MRLLLFFEWLFNTLDSSMAFLNKQSIGNVPNITILFMALACAVMLEKKYINIEFINKILSLIFMIAFWIIMIMALFIHDRVYLPICVTKKRYTPQQLFKIFSHSSFGYSYIMSVILTLLLSFMIFVTPFKVEIFYTLSALFTILWFSYHILNRTVGLKEIKLRLQYYLMLISLITSLIACYQPLENLVKPMIISLASAFTIIKYIIEAKEYQESTEIV